MNAADERTWVEAVEAHRAYLTAVARRQLAAGAAGEEGPSDLVQDVALAALDAARDGRAPDPGDGRWRPWLTRILRNKIRQAVRKHRARRRGGGAVFALLDLELSDSGTSPSAGEVRDEESLRVHRALARVDPRQRQILQWLVTDGLAVKAIAGHLGCSPSYASRACKDALNALRLAYRDEGGGSTL